MYIQNAIKPTSSAKNSLSSASEKVEIRGFGVVVFGKLSNRSFKPTIASGKTVVVVVLVLVVGASVDVVVVVLCVVVVR